MGIEAYDNVKEQVKQVIEYSQEFSVDPAALDNLMERWYAAKQRFINAWHGNLIVELDEDMIFTLSKDDQEREICKYLDWLYYHGRNTKLRDFISQNMDGVYENIVKHEYKYSEDKTIPEGMKLVKAFKYFIEDEKFLTEAQDKMSMLIQESKVKGHLCISIHPLDFLSSSENTYNWRSCHALDGEFRSGNLSYMVDASTVICYLKGADGVKLPHFPKEVLWNNKKWRMLMFFSDDYEHMMAGRQYPFFNRDALDTVRKLILTAEGKGPRNTDWTPWTNFMIEEVKLYEEEWPTYLKDRYVCMHDKLTPMKTLVKDNDDSLHYNDLLHSSCYVPYYSYYAGWCESNTKPRWHIGGAVKCLACGERTLTETEYMSCCVGEEHTYCACCGRKIRHSEYCRYVSYYDGYICGECEDSQGHECASCGEWYPDVALNYDEDNNIYKCNACFEEDEE